MLRLKCVRAFPMVYLKFLVCTNYPTPLFN
jgi:hypothetical protein